MHSLPPFEDEITGLDENSHAYRSILNSPVVQLGLRNPRVLCGKQLSCLLFSLSLTRTLPSCMRHRRERRLTLVAECGRRSFVFVLVVLVHDVAERGFISSPSLVA